MPRSEISRETAPAPAKSSSATHSNSNNNNSTLATQSAQKAGASPTGATFKPAASASASQQQHQSPPSQSDGKVSLEDYAYNKIFVGGLHYDTRDGTQPFYTHSTTKKLIIIRLILLFTLISTAEFRLYFEKYGKVISAEVMFNRETHKSRGFGFIVFEVESSAVKVCNVKEHSIDGKVVSIRRSFLFFFSNFQTSIIEFATIIDFIFTGGGKACDPSVTTARRHLHCGDQRWYVEGPTCFFDQRCQCVCWCQCWCRYVQIQHQCSAGDRSGQGSLYCQHCESQRHPEQ